MKTRAHANHFKNIPILVFGDIMLDRSIKGPVDRISPEAPVPVIRVVEERHAPGGAGNVANNLTALGAACRIIGVRGRDLQGDSLELDLKETGVDTSGLLIDASRPTISKTRIIASHQQVARLDREPPQSLSREMIRKLGQTLEEVLPDVKAVVISDYGKGVVCPPLLKLILRLSRKHRCIVTVDPKPEHFLTYRGVDCLTPNAKEAAEGMRSLPAKDDADIHRLGREIIKRLNVRSCLITQGEKGMALFQRGAGGVTHIPTRAKEVFDVTGAGDTVISAFTLARASGASAISAAHIANAAAGIAVAKLGTAAVSLEELKSQL